MEAVESRASAFEHQELLNLGSNGYPRTLSGHGLDNACLLAVAEKRVWMRLAVNSHARPAMLGDLDVCGMDVRIRFDEVRPEYSSEGLRWADGMLLCEYIARLFLCVGCNYDGVVCARIAVEG